MRSRQIIVLIASDPIAREALRAALEGLGFRVEPVTSAAQAVATVKSVQPHAAIIDLNMPNGAGWAVLGQMRGNREIRAIPVIVISPDAERSTVLWAARFKVKGLIPRGRFSFAALVEKAELAIAAMGGLPQSRGDKPDAASAESAGGLAAALPGSDSPRVGVLDNSPSAAMQRPISRASPLQDACAGTGLKELKPVVTRTELKEMIDRCEQLKAFSPTVQQLLTATARAECSLDRVVTIAKQDHAMTLKLLKMANSVVYGRTEPVDTLRGAVMRIGVDKIRQAALNIGIVEQFEQSALLDMQDFWEHAIGCGIVAAELAHATGVIDAEAAFTMGLLHDVGRLVLLQQLGDKYSSVVAAARRLCLPLEQVETRMLLINHAETMDRLLHSWKFSKQIINPVVFHHLSAGGIRSAAPRDLERVALLGIANRLAHSLLLGSSGNEFVYPTEELCELLSLEQAGLDGAASAASEQATELKAAMLSNTTARGWKSARERIVASVTVPFRPLFVSPEPQRDAFRIFCETLAGRASKADVPNVGVIHIPSSRHMVLASTRFRMAEEQCGAELLPLLVISPNGQLDVERGLAAGRVVTRVASPILIPSFVDSVNEMLSGSGARLPIPSPSARAA